MQVIPYTSRFEKAGMGLANQYEDIRIIRITEVQHVFAILYTITTAKLIAS